MCQALSWRNEKKKKTQEEREIAAMHARERRNNFQGAGQRCWGVGEGSEGGSPFQECGKHGEDAVKDGRSDCAITLKL